MFYALIVYLEKGKVKDGNMGLHVIKLIGFKIRPNTYGFLLIWHPLEPIYSKMIKIRARITYWTQK